MKTSTLWRTWVDIVASTSAGNADERLSRSVGKETWFSRSFRENRVTMVWKALNLCYPFPQNRFQPETIMTYWKSTVFGSTGWHYWGGVPYSSETYDVYPMCACGLNKTCVEPDINCNCDRKDETDDYLQDDGYLEHKQHLPVRAFLAGDTGDDKMRGIVSQFRLFWGFWGECTVMSIAFSQVKKMKMGFTQLVLSNVGEMFRKKKSKKSIRDHSHASFQSFPMERDEKFADVLHFEMPDMKLFLLLCRPEAGYDEEEVISDIG